MTQNQSLFFQKFGITPNDLQTYLGEALSAGGDYADLYFEYLTSTAISVDESIVKSASQGISAGCGVRVLAGDRTGYAYTDDMAPDKIRRAARTAAPIAPPALMIRGSCRYAAVTPTRCGRFWSSVLTERMPLTSSRWPASASIPSQSRVRTR